MERPWTIKCASFWDALVLRAMLEEQGAQVSPPPDEGVVLSMVASGTLDAIRAAVAQLHHEFPRSGPVMIDGEKQDEGADTEHSAAAGDHIAEETPIANPAQSQAVPRQCLASTANGSQCQLPAEPGDAMCANHARAMQPKTEPAAHEQSPESAEHAGGAQAQAAGSGPATGAPDAQERADPGQPLDGEVVIISGEARYHYSGCMLIRLLGSDDLKTSTRHKAEADGYVPCRACKPDKPLSAQT
jgi:hypothetical protein